MGQKSINIDNLKNEDSDLNFSDIEKKSNENYL